MINNRLDADLCGLCVSKEYVDALHENGLKVNCWTIDKLEHADLLKAAGVDFITSNILE
jgi:glycerophosphoryl diester phosphodiesterase